MIPLKGLALAATLGAVTTPADSIAQRSAPIAVSARAAVLSSGSQRPVARSNGVLASPDTTQPRRPRLAPFVIGGVVVGGVVGALLAASYDFCGEPSLGYACTSTDTATGAVIGAGVGLLAGLLTWTVVANRPPAGEPAR